MDPNAALAEYQAEMNGGSAARAHAIAGDLMGWVNLGGFLPSRWVREGLDRHQAMERCREMLWAAG